MDLHSHTDIPPSFQALYDAQRTARLKPVWAQMCARYELCEDMAQMLVDTAQTLQFQLGVTEADVLARIWLGLTPPDPVVTGDEARWVVHRLAELCGWAQADAAAAAPGVAPA